MFVFSITPGRGLWLTALFLVVAASASGQARGDVSGATAINVQITVHVQEAGGGTISVPTRVRLMSTNNPMGLDQMIGVGGVTVFNVAVGNYQIEVSASGYRTAREEVMATGGGNNQTYVMLRRDDGTSPAQASQKPRAPEVTGKARKELDQAVAALRDQKPAEAQKHIDFALKHAKGNPDVQYIAALCAMANNNAAAAQQYLEGAVTLFPEHVSAQVALGGLFLQQDKNEEAITHFERALAADPNAWRAHRLIAEAYLRNNRDLTKAKFHARRALELGKEKAAGADAIIARAEAAANPQPTLAAAPTAPLAAPMSSLIADVPTGPMRNIPLPLDQLIPPTDSSATCALDAVLTGAAQRAGEFTDALERFSATERFVHDDLDNSGMVRKSYNDSFQYLAALKWPRPDLMIINEMRNGKASVPNLPVPYVTEGLPAIGLIFHSGHQPNFKFSCEGLGYFHGQRAWQVRFEQRDDKPAQIHDWAERGRSYSMRLRGRAWISTGAYHLLRVETELVKSIPEIRLDMNHMAIEYAPVKSAGGRELWLPSNAEVFSKFRGRLFRQQHDFSDFVLFSVDSTEKIKTPPTEPKHNF